jgi:hypothetical protein
MLGVLTPEQERAKEKVEEHFNPKLKKSSLDQLLILANSPMETIIEYMERITLER